ncbi:MAG: hypothetical protein PHU85_07745 [Phycisphaerae bacterium]|nr:hypothetical protein [Phycisphaerae bacterium]
MNNRSVNAALLAIIVFTATYVLLFKFQAMPKFYPRLGGRITFETIEGQTAVKFVGASLVGFLVAVVGYIVGRRLPSRSGFVLHLLMWALLAGFAVFFILKEGNEYLWPGLVGG